MFHWSLRWTAEVSLNRVFPSMRAYVLQMPPATGCTRTLGTSVPTGNPPVRARLPSHLPSPVTTIMPYISFVTSHPQQGRFPLRSTFLQGGSWNVVPLSLTVPRDCCEASLMLALTLFQDSPTNRNSGVPGRPLTSLAQLQRQHQRYAQGAVAGAGRTFSMSHMSSELPP